MEWRKKGRKTSGGKIDMNENGLLKDFPYLLKEQGNARNISRNTKAYKTC